MKKFSAKILLASRGDAKNKRIFNSIDLKNRIKNVGHQFISVRLQPTYYFSAPPAYV